MVDLLEELYLLVRPSGRQRLAMVFGFIVLQAIFQSIAVFSVLPFLSAAADPAQFRGSALGRSLSGVTGSRSDEGVLLWAGVLALALLVCGNLLGLTADLVRARYAQAVGHRMRIDLLREVLDRQYEYFINTNSSLLLKQLIDDVSIVANVHIMSALDVLSRLLMTALLVAGAALLEPWVVLGGFALISLYYLVVVQPARRVMASLSKERSHFSQALYFEMQQVLSGIKPILASARAEHFMARVERASRGAAQVSARVPTYLAIPRSGLEILVFGGLIGWVLASILSGNYVLAVIPPVGLIAMIAYRLMPSIQVIFASMNAMAATRDSLDELRSLRAEQGKFRNPMRSEGRPVEQVSFVLTKGERMAFVGPTGSGKSTIIDLLLGLLEPTTGRILVDGRPLTRADMPSWREAVGYVPQELFLLDGTIADNIAFGESTDEQDRERVSDVADLVAAREFIEDGRSGGFEAAVGERGVRLSGGQRQRLALARALYRRPTLLIMDEAGSALDARTEQTIFAALESARDRFTIVAVTHRLSTVRAYDSIHYMERGRIVASGDFASLVKHAAFRELAG
jgi:ATP-binding cassette subfamily C protein